MFERIHYLNPICDTKLKSGIVANLCYVCFMFASTDLQCVFNGIREILQGADGDGLLWWILAGAVWLCEEGDHNLDVAFSTQSTGFE